MAIGGGLTNNCGKKRSKEQRRKEKIYVCGSRDPKEQQTEIRKTSQGSIQRNRRKQQNGKD